MLTPSPATKLRPLRDFFDLRVFASSVVLTLVASLLTLWLPRRLGNMVDALQAGELAGRDLLQSVAAYLGLALVAAAFSKWMRVVPMRWGPRVADQLRSRLYRHLLFLDESQIRHRRVGEVMSRLQSDVTAVADMLALGGHCLIRAGFTLGIAFFLMYRRSAALALWMSLLMPLLMVIGFFMLRSIRSRHLRVQEQLGVLTTYCQESFAGLRVLRGLGLAPLRQERFRELNQDYIQRNLLLSRVEIMAWPVIQAGFVLGNVILVWAGGARVIRGEIPLGMLVEFQQYLMVLQWPALSIAWSLSLLLRGRASRGRLQELLSEVPQVADGTHRLPAPPARLPIRYEQVGLCLEGQEVLRNISFEVAPGEMVGITGPTGSGKTLLLQILLRRQDPNAGRVTLGGVDIRDVPLEDLYARCRIAPQEPVLFSMSLEENLRLAHPGASDDDLHRAIELSALDADLAQLPHGLASRVGERGVTLSGGQRQRAAIARALLSDPSILLMDDSLSAVDTGTESRILEQLLPAVRGRTLMMVSHRYAALRHCDQVLVLRDGAIVERGTPHALLAAGGYFAELEARQRLQSRLEEQA